MDPLSSFSTSSVAISSSTTSLSLLSGVLGEEGFVDGMCTMRTCHMSAVHDNTASTSQGAEVPLPKVPQKNSAGAGAIYDIYLINIYMYPQVPVLAPRGFN